MSYGTLLRELIEKVGGGSEKALLREARQLEQQEIKSISDIKPETLERLRTRKMGIKGEGPEIPEEEATAFGRAIEEGSDVAPIYKERNLPAVISEKKELPSLQTRIKKSPVGKMQGTSQLPAGQQQLQLSAGQFEREIPSPVATLSDMKSAAASSLKNRIDQFKAPTVTAGGLGLAGSYAATQEEPARFPGDMSQKEVMTERQALTQVSALPVKEVKAPAGKPKTLAAALETPPSSKGPETQPRAAPSPYESEVSRLQDERMTAKEERKAEMDQLAKGELASLIGRSLTQIGAAATGMQKGIDMSGIAQKELIDWEKKREQIYNNYTQTIKELDTQQAVLTRQAERTEDKAERETARIAADKLARDKIAAENARTKKEQEIKESIALLKAYKDGDRASIKKIQEAAALKTKQIDREIAALDKIDGMYELYNVASGSKKDQQEAKIRQALRTAMGPEAVAGEKKSILGYEYDNKKSVDQIIKDVAKYKGDLQKSRDTQEQISFGVEQQTPTVPVATPSPSATVTPETPVASTMSMITVELDGKRGQVPTSGIKAFKKKYPGAKVVQ